MTDPQMDDPPPVRVARLYGLISFYVFFLAICTPAQTPELSPTPRPTSVLWTFSTSSAPLTHNNLPVPPEAGTEASSSPHSWPAWIRWLRIKDESDATDEQVATSAACPTTGTATNHHHDNDPDAWTFFNWIWIEESLVDPAILHPSEHTLTNLLDKILTSTPRLLACANFLLSLTYLLHACTADFFLGREWASRPEWNNREKLGGFLVFKLLLISAVVSPDTLDLLILLSWYTLLSFLRSLAHLCGNAIQHCTSAGQNPPSGVLKLLILVWFSNILAAASCVALFHGAGAGMVWLLTVDCALLGLDVLMQVLQHFLAVSEVKQAQLLSALEEEEEARLRRTVLRNESTHQNDDEHSMNPNQVQIQFLENQHNRRMRILDTAIFGAQLLSNLLTVSHFLHIWSLHGVKLTLIDGVLALHLHSAISSASRQIAQRRNLNRIARHLDHVFEDATELELRKHTTDVCCVCLSGLSSSVKKVACGHLFHGHCLREVVERARSIETAKCPLCRSSLVVGARPEGSGGDINIVGTATTRQSNDNHAGGGVDDTAPEGAQPQEPPPPPQQQQALFRFSTDAILPAWVPVPSFSFEVVRRPAQPPAPPNHGETSWLRRFLLMTGAVPMTPAEEANAIDQLVDMFPQYDRSSLLRELRQRGSMEGTIESVLSGAFTGIPR